MNFKGKYIDELIKIRNDARQNRDWDLSDKIRVYLDSKHVFVFDTEKGQIAYHRKNETRNGLIDKLKLGLSADKLFNAWLFSINASIKHTKYSAFIVLLLTLLY